MKARLFLLVPCLILACTVQSSVAGAAAKLFTLRVPDGWRVEYVPGSGIAAVIPRSKTFVMTLHAGETGGQHAADMARQASRIKNGSEPVKREEFAVEAYSYTWITPKGELAVATLLANKGKVLMLNIIGSPGPEETDVKNILQSLTSTDPAIHEIAREFRRE